MMASHKSTFLKTSSVMKQIATIDLWYTLGHLFSNLLKAIMDKLWSFKGASFILLFTNDYYILVEVTVILWHLVYSMHANAVHPFRIHPPAQRPSYLQWSWVSLKATSFREYAVLVSLGLTHFPNVMFFNSFHLDANGLIEKKNVPLCVCTKLLVLYMALNSASSSVGCYLFPYLQNGQLCIGL